MIKTITYNEIRKKDTESIFMLKDQNEDTTNIETGVKRIESLHDTPSNSITVVESEKCVRSLNIDSSPKHTNSEKTINERTPEKHLASDIFPYDPQGENVPLTNSAVVSQYIADLQKELSLENNKKLQVQLDVEKVEKEKEKEQGVKLEEKLRIEKEARNEEVKLRKTLEEKYRLQDVMKESKLRGLEAKLKLNENKFKNEVALIKKECEVIEKDRKRGELELKDVYQELGCLKKMVGERDRKMGEMREEMKVLQGIKNGFDSRIEQYRKERDTDLGKLHASLNELKVMTTPFFHRFRGRQSRKHQKIDDCISAVNNRIGCYP